MLVAPQPGRMVRHAPEGNLLRIADPYLDPAIRREVPVGGRVEVELALFHEDHQAGGGDRLGDRRQGVHRVHRGGDSPLDIGPSEGFFPEDFTISGDRNGQRGDA